MNSAIKNLIKRITTKGNTSDPGQIQQVTATYMGKEVQTQVFHDYGYVSSVPSGGKGFCLSPRGEDSDRVSMFFHPAHTVKDLKPGEVIVGNFVVSATLKFDEDGQGILTLPSNLIISCENLTATVRGDMSTTVSGNMTASVTGDASITSADCSITCDDFTVTASGGATITAPTITLDGTVAATSGMAVDGSMDNNGTDIGSGHKHGAGSYKDSSNGDVSGDSDTPI